EPVEFASAGLSADRADRQCQMPVLRRRVHAAPLNPVPAEPVLRLLRTAVRGPAGQGAWFVNAAADAPVTRDWFSVRYWMARDAVVARHTGRGAAIGFEESGRRFLLRHYLRGGMAAALSA